MVWCRGGTYTQTHNEWADGNDVKRLILSPDKLWKGTTKHSKTKLSRVHLFVIHTKEPLRTFLILQNSPSTVAVGICHFLPWHHLLGTHHRWQPDVLTGGAVAAVPEISFSQRANGVGGREEISSLKSFPNIPTSEKTETRGG